MPAYNPGSALSPPAANPSTGMPVLMNPFSGPKGSPKDKDSTGNNSTGALNTGIGFGLNVGVGMGASDLASGGNYRDNYTPGVTLPGGTAAIDARLTCIGGGRATISVTGGDYAKGVSTVSPYAVQPLLAFGNGQVRDEGAGPAYTGHAMKVVTAPSDIAAAGVIETGFTNRQGSTLKTGLSQFGSETSASPVVT